MEYFPMMFLRHLQRNKMILLYIQPTHRQQRNNCTKPLKVKLVLEHFIIHSHEKVEIRINILQPLKAQTGWKS